MPSDPVGQYMGIPDNAHLNGSEQVFIPLVGGAWRPGVRMLLYDPTQTNVSGTYPGNQRVAAVTVYGRAKDIPTAGWVMYDGGHTLAGSSGTANIAAQRQFLNFSFYAQLEKSPTIAVTGIPNQPLIVNTVYPLSANVSSLVANSFTYQWSASCAGTFSNPTGANTTFTPTVPGNCIITMKAVDPCGRTSFEKKAIQVNLGPQPPVGVANSYTFQAACITPGTYYDLDVLANDTDPEGQALTVTAVNGNNGTWTIVGNKVRFQPTANYFGTATATYTVCDPGPLCATGVGISVSLGTPDARGCLPGNAWGVTSSAFPGTTTADNTSPNSSISNAANATGAANYNEDITSTYALLNNNSDVLVIDLGSTISDTTKRIVVYYATGDDGNLATMQVAYGLVNNSFTSFGSSSTSDIAGADVTYKVPAAGLRYIRLTRNAGGADLRVDAVGVDTYACTSAQLTANPDQVALKEDFIATINVTANDNNPGSLALRLKILTQPANGVAVANVDNTITYQPNADFNGVNTFTYQICNSQGFCSTATVSVTVTADGCGVGQYRPLDPTVVSVTLNTTADAYIKEDGVTKTYGATSPLEVGKKATKAKRAILKFDLTGIPAGSTITSASLNMVRSGGDNNAVSMSVFRLTEDWLEGTGNNLDNNAGRNGSTWTDRTWLLDWTTSGGTYDNIAQSTISVTNVAPATKTFTGLASLAQFWLDNSASNFGAIVKSNNESGTVVDKRHQFYSRENGTASNRPTMSVTYQTPAPCAAIPNRAPLAANDNDYTTPSNIALSIPVLSNDVDYENNPITLTNASVSITELFGVRTGAAVGTAIISGNNILFTPAITFNGTAIIQYQISATGGTDNAYAYVAVTNALPILGNDAANVVNNTTVNVNVATNDSDPDGAGLQNPTIVSGPTYGSASFAGTILTYTPAANFVGTDVITYRSCELIDPSDCNPNPICTTATVTITVTNAPRVSNNVSLAKLPCVALNVNLLGLGIADQGTSLPLTITIISGPTGGGTGALVNNGDGTLTFTPTPGQALPATATYSWRVTDAGGVQSNPSDLTFNIANPANTAPVVLDVAETTPMDQPYYFSLTDYVSDPDGHTLATPTITVNPTHGILITLPNGLIEYKPNPGFFGTDAFTYQVCDIVTDPTTCNPSPGLCDIGVITIAVTAENVVYAINDQNTTWSGVAASGNLLTNDFDTDAADAPIIFLGVFINDVLQTTGTYQIAGTDENGSPVVNAGSIEIFADGTYSFTPVASFSGSVSIGYRISDSNENAAFGDGQIVIEVRDIASTANNLIANNDEAVSYQNTITENVLDNDVDPEGNTLTLSGFSYDTNGDGVLDGTGTLAAGTVIGGKTTTGVAVANAGTITLIANGDYTFVPAVDFSGSAEIAYEVCDNGLPVICKETVLKIIVVPNTNGASNDPPFAGDDFEIAIGSTITSGSLLANDSDPNGNPLTYTIQNVSTPEGIFTLDANGNYTFTAYPGFTGPVNLPYQVCDNGSPILCASATLHILVNEGQLTYPDINTTYINIPAQGDVSTNDKVEAGTTYNNPTGDVSNPPGATLNMNTNGSYTFTAPLPGNYVYLLNVCASGQLPTNSCPIEVLVLTVLDPGATNNLPVANTDLASTQINTAVTLKTLANDASGNPATSLNPSSVTVLTTIPVNIGTAVPQANGDIIFTPATGFTGSYTYTYQVCDDASTPNCNTATQEIMVLAASSANSTMAADDYVFTIGATPATGNVLTNDTDPEGNTQTVTAQNISIQGIGTFVLNTDGSYTFTAASGFSGAANFEYQVCDDGTPQACANATFYILVGTQKTNPDINATFINVLANGNVRTNDNVLGGTMYGTTPVLVSSPAGSTETLTMNANGTYTFTANEAGTYVYSIEVCKPGQSAPCPTELLSIAVNDFIAQTNPPLAHTDIATTLQDQGVIIKTLANDVSGNSSTALDLASVTITSPTLPVTTGVLSVSNTTGDITFEPHPDFVGTVNYTYQVCDLTSPTPLCAEAIQVITVLPTGSANSSSAADDFVSTTTSAPATGNVLNNDIDPEGDSRTTTIVGGTPTGTPGQTELTKTGIGTLTMNADGSFSFVSAFGFSGPTSFEYQVCDNGIPVACATATLDILVVGLIDVSGTIYIDTNDGTIDGTPSGTAGAQLYVSAVVAGTAIATVAVDASGAYSFIDLPTSAYTLVLHTTPAGAIAASLPSPWANSAEGVIAAGDGTPDGLIGSVSTTTTTANFAVKLFCDNLVDSDGDGVFDCDDLDDDNDGILDLVEVLSTADADGDGLPNHLDLDSDNDGVADVIEAGGTDPDNNGFAGTGPSNAALVDANGVPTIASGGYTPGDFDADGHPNYLDIDSDNDGIVDVIESQYTTISVVPSGNDNNNNGIDDAFDAAFGGAFTNILANNDLDANPDMYDLDADGDGISDETEANQGTYTAADADGDGLADVFDDYDNLNPPGSPTGTNANNNGQTSTNPFPNDHAGIGRPESNWRDFYSIWFDCLDNTWKDNSGTVVVLGPANADNILQPGCCTSPITSNTDLKKIIIPSCGIVTVTSCVEVTEFVINKGQFRLLPISDLEYGQYLGPAVEEMEFSMIMTEDGWHNIAFPVQLTALEWDVQNSTVTDPFIVKLDPELVVDSTNLLWWDPMTSSGREQGFFVTRNTGGGQPEAYSTHAYGTWNAVDATQDLSKRGFNYFIDGNFANTTRILKAIGTSHDEEVTYSTSDNFGGWNLIPNIYPVTISTEEMWDQGFFHENNNVNQPLLFDAAIWIWDAFDPNPAQPTQGLFGSGAYIAFDPQTGVALNAALYNGDARIAPFQSFWIRRTSAYTSRRLNEDNTNYSAVAEFVPSGATTDPVPLLIGSSTPVPNQPAGSRGMDEPVMMKPSFRSLCDITKHYKNDWDLMILRVSNQNDLNVSDMAEIVFDNNFTIGFDKGLDVNKLGTHKGYPLIFTVLDNQALAINKMPYPQDVTKVPVGVACEENGRPLSIDMFDMPEGWKVYLEDKLTGKWHDLSTGHYGFINDNNFRIDRFVLHFNKTGEAITAVTPEVNGWSNTDGLNVMFNNMRSPFAEIIVSNLVGQVIHTNKAVSTDGKYTIPVAKTEAQVYLITVITEELTTTIKVVR